MRTVVALYDRFDDAQRAIQALSEHGFHRDDINLVANDERGEYSRTLEGAADETASGAATGAGIGAVLGGLGGLLVGLGALAIPGIGPVLAAGPIVSALAGAGVGAVAGGLIGALVDLGIPEEHAGYYAEGIRRGGTLVTVRTEDHLAEDARMVLNRFDPVDIDTRAREWQSQGWTGFREDMSNRDMRDDSFRGVGSDLNTTDNIAGSRLGENYPRTDLDRDVADDYDRSTVSGVNTGIPVTGDEDFDDRPADTGEVTRMSDHMRDDVFGRDRPGTGDLDVPVTGGTAGMLDNTMSGYTGLDDPDWRLFDATYRADYQTRYAMSGYDYDYYAPAYRYGYDLAHEDTYRDYDWERLEPEARRDWERRGLEGAWEDVKDAVRHAWESITR